MVQGRRKRPLNALVLTRERIQEVLDDAVERGPDDPRRRDAISSPSSSGAGPAASPARAPARDRASARRSRSPTTRTSPRRRSPSALDGLDAAQLRAVRDHERRNANRKTVLAAVERKLPS